MTLNTTSKIHNTLILTLICKNKQQIIVANSSIDQDFSFMHNLVLNFQFNLCT